MATSKTLTPTNVTIQIPAFADKPDQRVNSNCIDKEADAINALSDQMANKAGISSTTINGSSSGNITIPNNFRGMLVTSSTAWRCRSLYILSCSGSGAVDKSDVLAGADLTLTTSTNTLTIANANTNNLVAALYTF